jgi:hypothetical protein
MFHNSTVVLKLAHWAGSTEGSQESFSFQNDRPRVALPAGMHEGLTLLEGSS